MKILVYGDSLCMNIQINDGTHIESCPGKTAEAMVNDECDSGFGISFYLGEDDYDVCVIIAGHNDLAHHQPLEDVINNLIILHEACRENGVTSYALSLPSWKTFNHEYQKKCEESGIKFIDLPEYTLEDGIHWSPESSQRVAEYIRERIIE